MSQLESFLAAESRALVEERAHVEELEGELQLLQKEVIKMLCHPGRVPQVGS